MVSKAHEPQIGHLTREEMMAKKILRAYCVDQPLVDVPHLPVHKTRAPTATDRDFAIGDSWIYKSDADNATQYNFGGLDSNQDAIWILSGPGSSEVDTIQGDSGGAIAPTAGNIVIAGGTNVTTVGTSGPGTITINLDAAIVLATSVSSPIYTVAAATDMSILGVGGQDIVVTLGGSAGAENFIVEALDGTDIWTVASDGTITFSGLTVTGAFVQTGGTFNVGQDNAANAINIGGGSTARAIAIANGTGVHTLALGAATGGAGSWDTAAGISLDAVTASNFTVTGTADLTLSSTGGSAILTSAEAAADAVKINASNAGGGLDIDAGTLGIAIDSTGAISLDAAAASNFSVSGAGIDLSLISTGGRAIVNAEEAAANAITLLSAAGGIDADAALQINVASSQVAADAIVINASAGGVDITAATNDLDLTATLGSANLTGGEADAAAVKINASNAGGGMDIDAGTLGIAIDSTGAVSIDAAAASNFSTSGAGIDLTLASAAGRVIVNAGEDAADAIYLHADAGTSETIRLHSDQGTGAASVGLVSDVGGITLTSGLASADAINLAAASGGIDIDGALEINIASSQAAATAVTIVASDAAGGITLTAGTGNVNVAGNLALTSVATQFIMNGGAVTDFIGQATLVNGEITVANTNIATTDRIFVTRSAINASTALGMPLTSITGSTSFKIETKSLVTPANDETGDQSTFDYVIVRQS